MGDFNSVPTTLPMTIIRDHAHLTDAWLASHPHLLDASSSGSVLDPSEAIERFGVTADSPLCSYSAGKPLDDHAREFLGKRLDYVLFRQPEHRKGPMLKCTQSKVVLTEKVPRRPFSYSDHFGLEATFRIFARSANSSINGSIATSGETSLKKSEGEVAAHEVTLSPRDVEDEPLPPTYLTHTSLGTVVHALTTCYRLSLARSQKYLYLFGGSIGLLVTCIVGSAWLPRSWANPVVVLLAGVTTWFGTTMLYVGFIYGRWEVNALLNIIEELEIHRSTLVDGE
jgi:sphingomyelin phosphodiesterase 2